MGFIILCILIIIVCLGLIAITVVQNSKKEDEGNSLSGFGVHILMGVKQTNEFLTGGTWILMGLLGLLSLGFYHVTKNKRTNFVSPNLQIVKEQEKLEELNTTENKDEQVEAQKKDLENNVDSDKK